MKFRILAGRHIDEKGRLYEGPIPNRKAEGDVIETEVDLVARFNQPGSKKFELVDELTPARYEEAAKTAAAQSAMLEKQIAMLQGRLEQARATLAAEPKAEQPTADDGGVAVATKAKLKLEQMSLNDMKRAAQAEEIEWPADLTDRRKAAEFLRSKGL
ncbi:MAG TPA: hypothetical protein VD932_02555 [Aquabacterium sp.]|nr:hypothetical protein [Aquabacterium sp.]